MIASGISRLSACSVLGVDRGTVARWMQREHRGEPLVQRATSRRRPVDVQLNAQVSDLVRDLHGLVGAESLRRSVAGVSRRQAAAIKVEALRDMERERRSAAERITVTAPGAVRSFDAMDLGHQRRDRYVLVAADAAVPYRTSWAAVARYDACATAALLKADFEAHGAPLVVRLDRARQHDAPEVKDVLQAHGVLVLHGPPYLARYYGQLERQNREHSAWLDALALDQACDLALPLERMMRALNTRWRRRRLDWRTSSEVWDTRAPLRVDRNELAEEVEDKTERIVRRLDVQIAPARDLAQRLAIEQALVRRGLLRREVGGWC